MKYIDHLIPIAIRAIEEKQIPLGENKEVPNEYKGYIDSFGASIVRNGLLPAVVFFENSRGDDSPGGGNVAENKKKLLEAILQVIRENKKPGVSLVEKTGSLYDYIIRAMNCQESPIDLRILRREVTEAAAAVKLALRTFTFSKSE
jgi:CRISPR/Cas system CMR-associated protein Cmr5 small subunit